jgi:hypothetical protein
MANSVWIGVRCRAGRRIALPVVRPAFASRARAHQMRRLRVCRKVLRMTEVPLHGLHRASSGAGRRDT